MTGLSVLAILLLLVGLALHVPVATVLAIAILLLDVIRAVWRRNGLREVSYRRRLARDRLGWGEEVETSIEVWNRKGLPLSWLRADDVASPGVTVRERDLVLGRQGDLVLRNAWTLAPYERVTRQFHVGSDRRGVFELGPVDLWAGDLFAQEAAAESRPTVDRFLVRPRVLAMSPVDRRDIVGGADRSRLGLLQDPSRFAGIREYAPGDPVRRVHQRASARVGRPLVKVFEPSRDREALVMVDVQTYPGMPWEGSVDSEAVEELFVIAASLVRTLAAGRAAVGLGSAAHHGAESRFALIQPSSAPGQVERLLDLLARLFGYPSAPFERLLATVQRQLRAGTTLLIVTARDPGSYLGHLRRIEQTGFPVVVLSAGPEADGHARRARTAGLAARSIRLDGPWRTARQVTIA